MRKLFSLLKRPAVALWGTIGLLLFYQLSAGPVVWLVWNVRLPEWVGEGLNWFYSPLNALTMNSEFYSQFWGMYRARCVGQMATGGPATRIGPAPELPQFLVVVSGAVIGAWLIWNLVSLVNERQKSKLDCPAPKTTE